MSERKTTEIKLRVTPDEKARWQLEADRQGIGLSELIRNDLNARTHMRRIARTPTQELRTQSPSVAQGTCIEDPGCFSCTDPDHCGRLRTVAGSGTSPKPGVGTTGEVGSVQSRPWSFEAFRDSR